MEARDRVCKSLNVPKQYIRCASKTRVTCLVCEDWVHTVLHGSLEAYRWKESLSQDECESLLAPSIACLPKPWTRISIKLIPKSNELVDCIEDGPLYNTDVDSTLLGHLSDTDRENFHNLWLASYTMYHGVHTSRCQCRKCQFTEYFLQYLRRIHPKAIKILEKNKNHHLPCQLSETQKKPLMQNVVPVLAIVESQESFFLVQPYIQFCIRDITAFSPAIFSSSHTKPLFVLYQVLHVMKTFHRHGVPVTFLDTRNVMIDTKLWVYLSNPHIAVTRGALVANNESQMAEDFESPRQKFPVQRLFSESDHMVEEGRNFIISSQYMQFELKDLPSLVEEWVHRKISNFKYIMVLNHLAGRRLGDPNHHPIIPWVMDFSGPDYGFRDLRKSKYRLNKGDNQLDLTYETFPGLLDDSHIPHHVSDVLSDITYYVYKARRTSKKILCAHVRPNWVPNEYPTSMQRMQEFTPDECIPEFFTDPTIFTSIHEDLPDIELPSWSNTAEDFISKHMEVLESEQVSEALHYWIDLMFGFKLTGSAAIKAKNINLQLVDEHKFVTNRGVIQLFNVPHPNRIPLSQAASKDPPRTPKNMLQSQMEILCSPFPEEAGFSMVNPSDSKMLGDSVEETGLSLDKRLSGGSQNRPENATIRLPKSYDPVAELDQLESLYSFSGKTMKTLPHTGVCKTMPSEADKKVDPVAQDMQTFGCLMCEIFAGTCLHMQEPKASLQQRYATLSKLYRENAYNFPRNIHKAIDTLLQFPDTTSSEGETICDVPFKYSLVNSIGLPPPTPVQLLHPLVDILPFPSYFSELYQCLCKLKEKDSEAEQIKWSNLHPPVEKLKIIKVIEREKVKVLQDFLECFQGKLNQEGLELILPYVEELFQNEVTAIPAAWSLFNLIGQEIGPTETCQRFLQSLIKLFSGENPSPKHMKIYHRSFLIQMLLRLGLNTFLTNFATLLVEAVAGYKNYVFENLYTDQQESDAFDELTDVKNHDSPDKNFLPSVEEESYHEDEDVTEGESVYSEFSTISSEYRRETEPTESTQDDIDEIEDEIIDNISLNEENQIIDEDEKSINSLSAEGSDDKSNKSDNEQNLGDSADRESIHSITHLLDRTHDLGCGDSDVGSYGDRTDTLIDNGSLQFEEQGDIDYNLDDTDNKLNSEPKSGSMVRSETDEFAQSMSERTAEEVVNISDVAAESIKWLSHRLGPLLTAKFLSRNLIRMLALCYLGDEQLITISVSDKKLPKTSRLVCGDRNALKILECLSLIAQMYGEQVILLQYIPCIVDMVNTARKRLTQKAESGLISCLVLLRHILPLLSDSTLMDILQDTVPSDTLSPVIKLVSSASCSFPGGKTARTIVCHKLIDVIYVIGLRVGFEMTRNHLSELLREFFNSFNQIHDNSQPASMVELGDNRKTTKTQLSTDDSYCNIKMDDNTHEYTVGTPVSLNNFNLSPNSPQSMMGLQGSRRSPYSLTVTSVEEREESPEHNMKDKENIIKELADVFTPELALASYIPLCRIFGSIHMEQHLPNDDLIRQLCSRCDSSLGSSVGSDSEPSSPTSDALSPTVMGSNVALTGNRIQLQQKISPAKSPEGFSYGPINRSSRLLRLDPDKTKSDQMEHFKRRHLRGNWLAYWEHELGLNERDTMFNFKQIKLQTFDSHSNSIRSLTALDNENSFISASKDKTVKLWSIKSYGDGSHKSRCQWTYKEHKKSVFSVAYVDSVRLVASCDSTVHIWDPFTCEVVRQLESTKYTPVTALIPCPSPSTMVITATTDSTLRFLDLRAAGYAHEYRTSVSNAGLIRCVTVGPDSNWVSIGFSSGIMSLLDLRTGLLQKTWKGHEGDILQMKAYNRNTFLTSSFDQTMKIWNVDDIKDSPPVKGQTEPVHCISIYKNQVISGTTGNRIGVHVSLENQGNFTSVKLKNDTFKGVLTSMVVLPMNRTLLLGADNGSIRLLC